MQVEEKEEDLPGTSGDPSPAIRSTHGGFISCPELLALLGRDSVSPGTILFFKSTLNLHHCYWNHPENSGKSPAGEKSTKAMPPLQFTTNSALRAMLNTFLSAALVILSRHEKVRKRDAVAYYAHAAVYVGVVQGTHWAVEYAHNGLEGSAVLRGKRGGGGRMGCYPTCTHLQG